MSAVPINAAAGRTFCKTLLREINEWRNFLKDFFLVHLLKNPIAFEAPRKRFEFFQIERTQYLSDLFFVIAALYEQAWSLHPATGQANVTCENDAPVPLRDPNHFIVVIFVRI